MSAELKEGYKKRKNVQKERKERLSEIKKRRMKGERNGRTEEWQRGRKEKMGEKIEGWEEGEEKMEKKKGKGRDAEQVLPLYFWIFHFYTCSLSISKISLGALRHPAPSSRLVDAPAESCV